MASSYVPETVTFNSGVFDIYTCDSRGKRGEIKSWGHHFGRRTLGATRYFAAAAAQVKVTDLICIPAGIKVDESDIIVIAGEYYSISQIQYITDGKPPHKLLTLKRERR